MYTASVLIPIAYSEENIFLKRNLIQIDKFKHSEVELEVLIADQTQSNEVNKVLSDLSLSYVSSFICQRVDAGWPIDLGIQRASNEYFLSLDVDCAPIHKAWAYLPIKLIEKYNLSCVGKQTALHMSYPMLGNFLAINNYYRTMRTSLAKYVSESVGFCRPENRNKVGFIPKKDYGWTIHADNGVYASAFMDKEDLGAKVSLALDKINGLTNKMGAWGMTIDSLIYHFVFSSSKDWINNKVDVLGNEYVHWYNRINVEGFTDQIFNELIDKLIPHHNLLYDREIFENGLLRTIKIEDIMFKDIEEWKRE